MSDVVEHPFVKLVILATHLVKAVLNLTGQFRQARFRALGNALDFVSRLLRCKARSLDALIDPSQLRADDSLDDKQWSDQKDSYTDVCGSALPMGAKRNYARAAASKTMTARPRIVRPAPISNARVEMSPRTGDESTLGDRLRWLHHRADGSPGDALFRALSRPAKSR